MEWEDAASCVEEVYEPFVVTLLNSGPTGNMVSLALQCQWISVINTISIMIPHFPLTRSAAVLLVYFSSD